MYCANDFIQEKKIGRYIKCTMKIDKDNMGSWFWQGKKFGQKCTIVNGRRWTIFVLSADKGADSDMTE